MADPIALCLAGWPSGLPRPGTAQGARILPSGLGRASNLRRRRCGGGRVRGEMPTRARPPSTGPNRPAALASRKSSPSLDVTRNNVCAGDSDHRGSEPSTTADDTSRARPKRASCPLRPTGCAMQFTPDRVMDVRDIKAHTPLCSCIAGRPFSFATPPSGRPPARRRRDRSWHRALPLAKASTHATPACPSQSLRHRQAHDLLRSHLAGRFGFDRQRMEPRLKLVLQRVVHQPVPPDHTLQQGEPSHRTALVSHRSSI